MEVLRFAISKRNIECIKNNLVDVIGDNADYEAHFVFDGEWAGKIKTARFVNPRTNRYRDVVLENDTCTIPVEMLKKGFLNIGVFADVITTKPCEVLVRESIKEKTGSVQPPTDDVYSQLIELIESGILKGDPGAVFIPAVSEEGIISWTNNGGLQNPEQVDIMGPQGLSGLDGFSPIITISPIEGGNRVTITDKSGTHVFDVLNGVGGTDNHSQLTHRSDDDQHPMSAITGLNSALAGKQPIGDYALRSEIPSVEGLASESWVQNQGYLTQHQDISGKADASYVDTAIATAIAGVDDLIGSGVI